MIIIYRHPETNTTLHLETTTEQITIATMNKPVLVEIQVPLRAYLQKDARLFLGILEVA